MRKFQWSNRRLNNCKT